MGTALEEEEGYLDSPVELDSLDDDGNDDAESPDLQVGEEIDLLSETVGDNEPIELDLGTLVGAESIFGDSLDDNDAGFEVDPALGLALPDALAPDDGAEGLDDHDITVDESKFPGLDMDDGSEGIAAEHAISLGTASDEAPLAMASVPWLVSALPASLEACVALACGAGDVVAGSSDLLWFRGDSPTPLRVAIDGSALTDVALLGAALDVALACTASGQVFRRARFASQAEQLTRFREPLRSASASRAQLAFGGALGTLGGRCLLWARDGALLELFDAGDRFERVELDGKVSAVARESATVLLARGRQRLLLSLENNSSEALSGPALLVAEGSAPFLATAGSAIALAEPGRALLVSTDRGKSFRRVAGSAGATAIAGAEVSGSARFFAAVYRETTDRTEILLVDPELAEAVCIARLDVPREHSPSDAIDRGEWAKVARLSFHSATGRLWATGGFGVLGFAPGEPVQSP